MDRLLSWIDRHSDELVSVYKKLHAAPEAAFKEFKTSAFLAEELEKEGYEVQTKIAGTGVVGTLKGKSPGLTFALRADMDALPMEEKTGLPYASTHPGVMHACGHDSHCAMVLFVAKAIAATGGIARGTLKIVFQPAEEILKGALAMIESGVLKEVDEIVGIHMRNASEVRVGEASPAINHGGCWRMNAKLHGRAAHAAWPHKGVNVIDAVAAIVNATNAIHMDPSVSHSVKITRCIAGGEAVNIIPDFAELSFDLRAQNNTVMTELQEKAQNAVRTGAASVGATSEIVVLGGVPAANLDPNLVAEASASIEAVLGQGRSLPPVYSPGSEDFHCYSVNAGIKSAFIGIGGDMGTGGHTPTMCLDLAAIPQGAKVLAHLTASKLR